MKYAEINKAFTEAVAAKIADGYTICTNTMSGSQGEIAFVNFVKENKFYSLTLDRFHPFGEKENYLEAYVMRFIVSNDLEDGDKIGANLHRTMWRGEKYTTTIEERRWYKIEGADWFVSKEEAVKITKKIKEHWANERDDDIFEFVVAATPKNRKLVASLYMKNRTKRLQPAISAKDIVSARVEHLKGRAIKLFVRTERKCESVVVYGV